jgi:hypothetical protein
MLNLTEDGVVIQTVQPGAWFALPNGDAVSPAYAGWESGSYALVEAPPAPPIQPTKEQQQAARQFAYTQEADPLFFMSQRGEATESEWLAKVEEIKARYPYPVGSA